MVLASKFTLQVLLTFCSVAKILEKLQVLLTSF